MLPVQGYSGGVVVVSHDRRFMSDVAKEVWQIKSKDRSLVRLEGGLQEVSRSVMGQGLPRYDRP